VQRRATARRAWNIPYDYLQSRDADILNAFYLGMYGEGPFRFVDPDAVNMLPADTSVCGARTSAPIGWAGLTSSTVARSTDILPPTDAPASGVLKVHHAATASAGLLFDASLAAPLLPDESDHRLRVRVLPDVGERDHQLPAAFSERHAAVDGALDSGCAGRRVAPVRRHPRRRRVRRVRLLRRQLISPDLYLAAGQLEYARRRLSGGSVGECPACSSTPPRVAP
jgi:hypothetical protein